MRCDEIGVRVSRQGFVDFLNSVQGGQYFSIKGYVNEDGEKSDHVLRYGIVYPRIKDRDVALLRDVLAGKLHSPLRVTHGVWIDPMRLGPMFLSAEAIAALPDRKRAELVNMSVSTLVPLAGAELDGATARMNLAGTVDPMDVETLSSRKGKGRVQATVSYDIPFHHPLVVAAIGAEDLTGTLLQGLLRPHEATTGYDKEAKSCYSKADDPGRWYVRDVLAVSKVVRVAGDYQFSATIPLNAVKTTIRREWLLTGKYRQFVLTDGQFESITIEGQAVLCDGVDEQFYFALPEGVKAELERVEA